MVSRRTRVASWIFRRDHPSRPNAMICCFFSSFKTFAMLREATYPPAAVNVLDVSSESMAAFQVFMYGRFWVFTEVFSGGTIGSGAVFTVAEIVEYSSTLSSVQREVNKTYFRRRYDLPIRRNYFLSLIGLFKRP